jgi:hypothetical protein
VQRRLQSAEDVNAKPITVPKMQVRVANRVGALIASCHLQSSCTGGRCIRLSSYYLVISDWPMHVMESEVRD